MPFIKNDNVKISRIYLNLQVLIYVTEYLELQVQIE